MLNQRGPNNKWTYDLTGHVMVYLETIIALAFMTYIVDLFAYELHPGDEKVFNDFINARVLHYTYDRGSLLFKIIFLYLFKRLYL
jgi:hypothetical protein